MLSHNIFTVMLTTQYVEYISKNVVVYSIKMCDLFRFKCVFVRFKNAVYITF